MPEAGSILGQSTSNWSHQWSRQSLALWAKSGDEEGALSLPQHLLDAAGVADQLWVTWIPEKVRGLVADELGVSDDDCHRLVVWLAATHDIGKASIPFAAMLEDNPQYRHLGDAVRDSGLRLPGKVIPADYYHHSVASQVILTNWLRNHYDCRLRVAESLAAVAGGHHGLPAFSDQVAHARDHLRKHEEGWNAVHDEIVTAMTDLTGAKQALGRCLASDQYLTDPVQLLLTAIVIVADWIASNADAFPIRSGASYDQSRISRGMDAVSLPPLWSPTDSGLSAQGLYQRSFGWDADRRPFPVQEAALEVARNCDTPSIICIEAPMGNGKTEAALTASYILAARLGCSGLMLAAPTMATSDSLFSRTATWAQSIVNMAIVSMYLGHSKNTLNEDFGNMSRMSSIELHEREDGKTLTVAHDWLWGRKKGILSSIVVGTVDQLLFMALQSKHMMLRHLGLAGKVVVIDEVHAYDAYMSSYLEAALEWLGCYQVPVILLSATLPHSVKSRLMAAYRAGLIGEDPEDVVDSVPASGDQYPAITVADSESMVLHPVPGAVREMTVTVSPLSDSDLDLRSVLAPVIEEGGCALVLCNTVKRAQAAYLMISELVDGDARLIHARFTAAERVEKERQLRAELGPPEKGAESRRPKRRIVVATQVVEQSLDLDFDLIITDIAPVDLLLQRIGRLHRHVRAASQRPAAVSTPRAFVRGITEFGDDAQPPVFDEAAQKIYPRALLLDTFVALDLGKGGTSVKLPGQIPSLVRDVYSGAVAIPPAWDEDYLRARGDLRRLRESARRRAETFQLPPPYTVQAFAELWADQGADIANNATSEQRGFAQVRDSDPTLEVVLCQEVPGGYRPLPWIGAGHADTVLIEGQPPEPRFAGDLATSTVRLPYRYSYPKTFDKALDQLERDTDPAWHDSPLLRGQLQLKLDESFEVTLANHKLRYDVEMGLIDVEVEAVEGNK